MSNFLIDEDTDLLAAEFVLGTLDSEERANAQSLLRTDHGFIAMVRIWERRFGELHLMVEPVEPDAKILQRIKAQIAQIAPREPAPEDKPPPDGKPPTEMTASPAPPEAAVSPANGETPQPADGLPVGDVPKPQDASADGTTPPPTETPASGETQAEIQPAASTAAEVVATAPEGPTTPEGAIAAEGHLPGGPELRLSDLGVKTESAPAAIPVPPPSPPPPLKVSEKPQSQRTARSEIDVIRSRGRWRAVGVCMTLLVMGLAALLAAWKFIPDRLPAELRPAQLMMSIGIEGLPKSEVPAVKPASPVAPFDE
jgi:hypothetical protein